MNGAAGQIQAAAGQAQAQLGNALSSGQAQLGSALASALSTAHGVVPATTQPSLSIGTGSLTASTSGIQATAPSISAGGGSLEHHPPRPALAPRPPLPPVTPTPTPPAATAPAVTLARGGGADGPAPPRPPDPHRHGPHTSAAMPLPPERAVAAALLTAIADGGRHPLRELRPRLAADLSVSAEDLSATVGGNPRESRFAFTVGHARTLLTRRGLAEMVEPGVIAITLAGLDLIGAGGTAEEIEARLLPSAVRPPRSSPGSPTGVPPTR